MSPFIQFLATLAASALFGTLLGKTKMPGSMLVGSVAGTALLNIFFFGAYVPLGGKIAAQSMAGAFIGISMERKDLRRLAFIGKPAVILMGMYLVLNLGLGFLIAAVSPLDLPTAFFSAVPGGMTDIPLISADMGADVTKVTGMQFVRLIVSLSFFPTMVGKVAAPSAHGPLSEDAEHPSAPLGYLPVLAVALVFGTLGHYSRIPAGILIFSLTAVLGYSFLRGKADFPHWTRGFAQMLAGAYIGAGITSRDIAELAYLLIPAFILMTGYTLNCFFTGWLLRRHCGMTHRESMLAAIPAGATDMALISMDLGVQSADLILLQVLRVIVVSTIFPQILYVLLHLLGAIS